jgi:anti-sigma factor RsiW
MTCSSVDLKACFLGDLPSGEKALVEKHLDACAGCREEMDRLDATRAALVSLADEEPPQRIAFVSDKIFEPRWFQRIWQSGPVMGFASAAVLAVAILAHAYARPAAPPVNTAQMEQRIQQQVDGRVTAAVTKAVADVEQRQNQRIAQAVATAEQRFDAQYRGALSDARQMTAYYRDQNARFLVASNGVASNGGSR